MAETTATPDNSSPAIIPVAPSVEPGSGSESGAQGSKAGFAKAIEDAKASAQSLAAQAQDAAGQYREKFSGTMDDARAMGDQAKERAAALAQDGKARTVEGLSSVSRLVAETAPTIDEKLGVKYGDYARSAAKAVEDAAARLEAKDLGELGDDVRELVRKSPAVAVGVAAVAGFMLSRLFSGSKSDD